MLLISGDNLAERIRGSQRPSRRKVPAAYVFDHQLRRPSVDRTELSVCKSWQPVTAPVSRKREAKMSPSVKGFEPEAKVAWTVHIAHACANGLEKPDSGTELMSHSHKDLLADPISGLERFSVSEP
jgi:hypothetical protein